MIIECPGCQETYQVDMPSLESDGIEIHCKNCDRSFLIKPHGAQSQGNGPQGDDPAPTRPTAPATDASSVSPQGATMEMECSESLFLQRDEIPYSIVQAYQEQGERQAPVPVDEPEAISSPQEARETVDVEPSDIDLDEDEMGEPYEHGGLAANKYFSTPYPLGEDLVIGRRRPKRRLGLWLGGGLTAVVVVLMALLVGRCSGQQPWERVKKLGQGMSSLLPFNRLESGKIQISDLNGYFQDRARKGASVFVIEGNVTNRYTSPCHSIQVKGILFDERGNRAAEEVVYCGNVLTTAQIRSSPRKKIEQSLQNAYGATLSNFNIEPGKSVPFMLIFFDPPAKLSEYSLEVHQYTLQDSDSR